MVNVFQVNSDHVKFLERYTDHRIALHKFDYFLYCSGSELLPVSVKDGALVYKDPKSGREESVTYVLS